MDRDFDSGIFNLAFVFVQSYGALLHFFSHSYCIGTLTRCHQDNPDLLKVGR